MGYRSDVAYIIVGKDEDMIPFLIKMRLEAGPEHKALEECVVSQLKPDYMYIGFRCEDVKWYDSYKDVAWHDTLWNTISDNELFEGRFVRVGEDDDDLENKSFGNGDMDLWEYLSITRHLDVGFSTDAKDDIRATLKEPVCPP